jgi:hypothetical protein
MPRPRTTPSSPTGIEQALALFRETLARLDALSGLGRDVAEVVTSETGADTSRFPTLAI